MERFITDVLRDAQLLSFWAMALLPILGAVSLTQIWKLYRRDTTGSKPRNYMCQLVSTCTCAVLSTLVYGLMGEEGWAHALGTGIMIGPAAPLLWWMGKALAPDRISAAMRGERRKSARNGDAAWSDKQRHDTLYGDDTTLRDKIRRARGEREN